MGISVMTPWNCSITNALHLLLLTLSNKVTSDFKRQTLRWGHACCFSYFVKFVSCFLSNQPHKLYSLCSDKIKMLCLQEMKEMNQDILLPFQKKDLLVHVSTIKSITIKVNPPSFVILIHLIFIVGFAE